jgi:hydrogenase maturation factor
VETGKAGLKDIRNILKRNRGVMLKSNIIGSDFSFLKRKEEYLVFKIEPMVFYRSLSINENALLSVIFPLNDFVTSGTWPSIAMIDFEGPTGAGKEFYEYVDRILHLLGERGIKVASGHTGSYGNLGYGVAGTMALVGFNEPIFSFRRVSREDSFYSVGLLGNELSFFRERKGGNVAKDPLDLSIETYISEFLKIRKAVHFVHDISEGGLMRALGELSYLLHFGFNVESGDLKPVTAEGVRDYGSRIFSSSSSGSLVVSVDSKRKKEFEKVAKDNSWYVFEIGKTAGGVTLDGKRYEAADSVLDFLL